MRVRAGEPPVAVVRIARRGGDSAEQVLEEIRQELVALLGGGVTSEAIRVDVDVFQGGEPLVAGRWLDSLDMVQVLAALEERFGIRLAEALAGDEPLTLATIARHVAGALARSPSPPAS